MRKVKGKQLVRGNIRCKTPPIANTGANQLAKCSEKLGPPQSLTSPCAEQLNPSSGKEKGKEKNGGWAGRMKVNDFLSFTVPRCPKGEC